MKLATLFALAGILAPAVVPVACAAPATSSYHLLTTHTLGGDGGWDYLAFDASHHRLFISRGSHVMVVDPDSGKVVGDIAGTNGVHGIAFAPEAGRGFTSNGRDSSASVFDLETLAPVSARPTTGAGPDAIGYDAQTRRVFTFNGRANTATAIDAATGNVVGTIPLGGRPESCAFDGKGKGYVDLEDKSAIVEFDTKALTVLHTWPVGPGEEPAGLALDAAHHRLFAGCGNKLMAVVNTETGKVVTTLPIGEGVDYCAFDPGAGFAFASAGGGGGTLTVVHEDDADHFSVAQQLTTQPRARTMALDPKTHRVYLVTADFGTAPAPTAEMPRPRAPMVAGSFRLLVLAPGDAH
jgi:YVTN family beta-propeller protein